MSNKDVVILGYIDRDGNAAPMPTDQGVLLQKQGYQAWEYREEVFRFFNDISEGLNPLGQEGWETFYQRYDEESKQYFFVLKRPYDPERYKD